MPPSNSEQSLFLAALDLKTPAERDAFLKGACGSDQAMLTNVQALLAAHNQSDQFLERPPTDRTHDFRPLTEGPGMQIGPYKLLQHIGEGGFGAVYMAEQEHPVRRKVALKIIKPGMDTREVIARFESERQALAMMEHPNIAKVFDAGATESGRPYFVMELVRGVPITEFCDKNRLPAEQRLKLFVTVCHAIQHAHHKGIIHRDIKPSNVMVTLHDGVPVVKVIDFGVAKATAQKLTERTLFTAYGQMIGTPAYMSPEQAEMSGLDIDMRSDIFSLGVLLYELLTGTTPLDSVQLRQAGYAEMQRLIREEEAPRPSTRFSSLGGEATTVLATNRGTDVRRLSQLLRSDLDWIVMKSLEKDRNRRYGSPDNFAADVERYLTEQPVEARPPSTWYRFRKTARRNKAALTTAAMVATVLVLGTAVSVWQAARAKNAEMTARVAEAKARESEDAAIRHAETANDERLLAAKERARAEQERDAAQAAKTELRRSLYTASMSLIPIAWKADHIGSAMELLDQQRPKSGEEDMRGFEWHHWDRRYHSERRELVLDQYEFRYTLSGDGRFGVFSKRTDPNSNPQGEGGTIDIIDLGSGKVVKSFPVPIGRIIECLLNHDGSRLATRSTIDRLSDWQVTVRNVADGKELFRTTIDSVASGLNSFPSPSWAISRDGKRLATAAGGGRLTGGRFYFDASTKYAVNIWEVDDFAREPTVFTQIVAQDNGMGQLRFSPDGKRLAVVRTAAQGPWNSRSPFVTVHVLDLVTGKILEPFEVPSKRFDIAFSPDGARLIGAASSPLRTLLWEIEADGQIKQLRSTPIETTRTITENSGLGINTSPDGQLLAVYSTGSTNTWLIKAETGKSRGELISPGGARAGRFKDDGTGILVLSQRETTSSASGLVLREWDLGAEDTQREETHSDGDSLKETIVKSRNGERQAHYLPKTGKLSIRDRTGTELQSLFIGPPMDLGGSRGIIYPRVGFSPNGRFLFFTESPDKKIYETDSGKVMWEGSSGWAYARISQDNRLLALHEANGFKIVNFDDFHERALISNQAPLISNQARIAYFSPDGRKLVTVTHKGVRNDEGVPNDEQTIAKLELWESETGREISSAPIGSLFVVFSANSRVYATWAGGEVTVWDANSGSMNSTVAVESQPGRVVLNPEGTSLIATKYNFSDIGSDPAVWDTSTGKLKFRLEGLRGALASIIYSPDGKRIATVSSFEKNTEVKLWDASNGHELLSLPVTASVNITVIAVRGREILFFSPDGHRLTFDDGQGNETT